LVVVAPGSVPQHDTVLLPIKPVKVTIPASGADVVKSVSIKVRNADIPEQAGHIVQLSVEPGSCPDLIVDGAPDFDSKTAGDQSSILLVGGKTRAAKVRLRIRDADFAPYNGKAPKRCSLVVRASTLVLNNEDPTARNNVQPLEINVLDKSDPGPAMPTEHESVLTSIAPAKLTIAESGAPATKTVRVKVSNADQGDGVSGHSVTVSVDQGDCPAGTLSVQAPATVSVPALANAKVALTVNAATAGFTAANAKSTGRCTALITATTNVMGNVEPDVSNNTSSLVIEVNDKTDY
jgi:hypothetical protein